MEIFGAIAGLFLAVSNPQWFDKGPYEYVNTYTTIEDWKLLKIILQLLQKFPLFYISL
jgi:hypothetical protein